MEILSTSPWPEIVGAAANLLLHLLSDYVDR
jgi:hypothetical protein